MKKNAKKFLALLLGTVMATGLLAGCGSKGDSPETGIETTESGKANTQDSAEAGGSGPDISEHVDITMYLVGDTPETYDDILAKVNEITEREINASLNVKWLS